jgi:hypothetical protein
MNPIDTEMAKALIIPASLGANKQLPALNPFMARSTYALILTVLVTTASAKGVDLFAFTESLGWGADADSVLNNGQAAVSWLQIGISAAAPIWYAIERRAPNFRLSFAKW